MSVILLILKIIGMILLTLAALLLLIIFLVLFVPVRYRTDGDIGENVRMQGKVHWMLAVLSFHFSYNEEGFSSVLKFFGKRISLGEKSEEEEAPDADGTVRKMEAEDGNMSPSDLKVQQKDTGSTDITEQHQKDGNIKYAAGRQQKDSNIKYAAERQQKNSSSEDIAELQRKDVSVKDAEASEKKNSEDGTDTKEQASIVQKNAEKTASQKTSFGQKITGKFHDITDKIKGVREKMADLSRQAAKIKAAMTDGHNRNSASVIWKELKYLLKHSCFRKIDTELNFALWEPSATGQALGVLAMFPAIYQYEIGIYPDFEADRAYVKGTFEIKGHIRLIHVLISGIRLMKERDIRDLIKKVFR